jgi:hypothetical protein
VGTSDGGTPITVAEPDNPHALIFRGMDARVWEKVAGESDDRRAPSSNRRAELNIRERDVPVSGLTQSSPRNVYDPKPTSGGAPPEQRVGCKTAADHCCGTLCFSRCVTAACWTGLSNQDQRQIHEAPRDGISGFGGGGRSRSTSRMPSSETQAISQNASM